MPTTLPTFKTALVDADLLVYRVGFASAGTPEGIARARLDEMYKRILEATQAERVISYLTSTDKSNFRFTLFPEYKANRVQPKPEHYLMLREYLTDQYFATVVHGQEADDAIGIAAMQEPQSVVCTIDKDLDMIPGWHYNFVQDRLYLINELEAFRAFYRQCLEGDKGTDNIEGCAGIGKVKAERILVGCESETEMFEAVLRTYEKTYPVPEAWERLWLAGSLLWIRRKPEQVWPLNGSPVSKEILATYWTTSESPISTKPNESDTSSQSPITST